MSANDFCAPARSLGCGRYTEPDSLARFDVSAMCDSSGAGLIARNDPTWVVNVCGTVRGGCPRDSSRFCAFDEDSVCGIDDLARTAGMALRRNFSEPCGSSSCVRCGVAGGDAADGVDYALLDHADPGKGFRARLAPVALTPAQRDRRDRGGFCEGGSGRVAQLRFVCDCSRELPVLTEVWANADKTCELNFDVVSRFSCYEGFCEGKPPPAWAKSSGSSVSWLVFLFVLGVAFALYAKARSLDLSKLLTLPVAVVATIASVVYARVLALGVSRSGGYAPPPTARGATIFAAVPASAAHDLGMDEQL